ncbi:MAG: DUF4339 domain-containing protein [Beijerinckiaceae bacterium]|jgi:hypothetical protein
MNPVFWYLDAQRERRGPFEREDIVGFIRNGIIVRDTLVWDSSLNEWRAAAALPEFSVLFGGSVPPSGAAMPPLPLEGGPLAFAQSGALKADIPVWGLFWRGLVRSIGFLFIVPAPWAAAFFFRFLCSRISLPNGVKLSFAGKAGDIWYIHVAIAILALVGQYHHAMDGHNHHAADGPQYFAVIIATPISLILQTYVIRWYCAKLRAADGSLNISFEGNIFGLLGWSLLFVLSFLTIIGWAWVLKAMYRWMCRNVRGTHRFEFTATGWDLLWRLVAAFLMCIFIIPIPWVIRWLTSWWISKVSVAT